MESANTFQIHYTPKKAPGKPTYEFIITTDKTKEKIQNELLRNNEMKLKATLESLQKYIIVIDSKGFIINYYKPSSSITLCI
jgi:PAS domain-containing protein